MPPPAAVSGEDDDARHRREEAERRAKRKAAKSTRSDSQKEKDRKRKEHAQKVLQQQQQKQQGSPKRSKTTPTPTGKSSAIPESSKFDQLFAQRAQGFLIDFKFANAPPRPPVGPCFVGLGLDGYLLERTTFKPSALAEDFVWKLHSEPDLGVPLARWAMDIQSYQGGKEVAAQAKNYILHPDDLALLEWKGSMGDTAAEELKQRREQARAKARLVMEGKAPKSATPAIGARKGSSLEKSRKSFSRVLPENMQSWMKKTTYMANDYSRKVHDFKSLAQTKQQAAEDLELKQQEIAKRKSALAIAKVFDTVQANLSSTAIATLKHPTNPNLKAVQVMPLLPNVEHWGYAYTHVIMDKPPTLMQNRDPVDLNQAMIAHVERAASNSRMSCQVLIPQMDQQEKAPAVPIEDGGNNESNQDPDKNVRYTDVQEYDLDVIPLKESEDTPPVHYCLWIDEEQGITTYLPIPSRVQLSSGRPPQDGGLQETLVSRRAPGGDDLADVEERRAEVDVDLALKYKRDGRSSYGNSHTRSDFAVNQRDEIMNEDDDDEDDDHGDAGFGSRTATIVAEG